MAVDERDLCGEGAITGWVKGGKRFEISAHQRPSAVPKWLGG